MKARVFFIWILFMWLGVNIQASVDVHSTFITTNEGLANNSVRYLFQDSKGFIWMGTLDGLSRYDGHSFVTFRPGMGGGITLADHHVKKIMEDKNGFLWFITAPELLSCYDLRHDCFVDFTGCGEYKQEYNKILETSNGTIWLWHHKNGCRQVVCKDGKFTSQAYTKANGRLLSDSVNFIHEDHSGDIWICTQTGLVWLTDNNQYIFKKEQAFVTAISYNDKSFFVTLNGNIYEKAQGKELCLVEQLPWSFSSFPTYEHCRIQEDWVFLTPKGTAVFRMTENCLVDDPLLNIPYGKCEKDNLDNLWISNGTGEVYYVNIKTRKVKIFKLMPYKKAVSIASDRFHILQDIHRGLIWISTYGNGLFVYNPATEELTHFTYHVEKFNRINSDFLLYMMGDRTGNIWLGSEYSGIALLSVLNDGANRLYPEGDTLVDRSNTFRMVTCLENGEVWVGNRRGGLFCYDSELKLLQRESYNLSIFAVKEDSKGKKWMGTRGAGLNVDGCWYVNNSVDVTSLAFDHIYDIHRDYKGRMWIGTFGKGLDLAVRQNNKYNFRHFLTGSLGEQQIRTITGDKNNWMWVGTNNGVYVFHPDSLINNPQQYYIYNLDNGKMRSNEIRNIFCDSKGRIWVGTTGTGFAVCNLEQNYEKLEFQYYDVSNGLVNNVVQSIVEDKEGKIWLGTEYGMSRFDPDLKTFDNFFFSAIMPGNVYLESSACVMKNGHLLFGTNHGLVVVDPEKVMPQHVASLVSLTDLKINGISVRPGDVDSPLTEALSYTDKIELKYYQNSFSIDFSTFDYSMANDAKYIYKLIPYDNDWSVPSSLNFAAYKNLLPGAYQLYVKASGASGVWGEDEAVLQIVITPPFWKTGG